MTTPTSNPVPSNDPRDLLFNAEALDSAVNSAALEFTDRKGLNRLTVAGATNLLKVINPRGPWASGTLYQPRDLVSNSGTWYVCLDTHTSGASFAGDQAAHWRIYQGVISTDLSTTGAGKGSAAIAHIDSGASAVPVTVDAKLKQWVSRSEFPSDATFNAAKGARPSIDGSSNLDAKVTPAAEPTQGTLSDMLRPVAAGPRDAIVYNNATSVRVFRNHAVMGGFRFRGQYTKGRAPCFPMPTSKVASVSTGLGAEAAVRTENWYAIFACANAGDATATIKVMPYLRAGTVSGSNVPLIKAGEGIHALTAQTYAWSATNNLAGTDCLVISEGGAFSGRVTTITANVAGQVTLGTIGSVAAYDFLLPAPPGFTHYVYLGSFYFDTAEVRNIYDSGTLAKGKMIYPLQPSAALTGAVPGPPGAVFDFAGYICPLATAVVFDSACVLSTASAGGYAEYFDPDGANHIVDSRFVSKNSATSEPVVFSNIEVPFLYHQKLNYYNAGSLNAARIAGQFNTTGWIEP